MKWRYAIRYWYMVLRAAALIAIVLFVILPIIFVWVSSMFEPSKEIPQSESHKIILNAVATQVDGAPKGTYIIEYSNGNKEVLHPDGRRIPLIISDQQPKEQNEL